MIMTGTAHAQTEHVAEISIIGPDSTHPPGRFTLEIWGSFSSPDFIDGTSAMAGFGIGIETTGLAGAPWSIDEIQNAPWATGFGHIGTIDGTDVEEVSGGQLANLFGILNPDIYLSNPILLFTMTVESPSSPGYLELTPMNPNPNGGLSFYPDSTDGASIVAPNDPGTSIHFESWSWQVPAPSSIACLALWGMVSSRRRRTLSLSQFDNAIDFNS